MNALRISLPSSPRTGMFCRLGSDEESRPVAVAVWLNDVCMCPVRGFISFGSASTYVPNSFFNPLCSSILPTISCFPLSCCSTSSDVTYCPVFVFLGFSTIFSLPNKISPTCLGDAMLNSSPASSYMRFSMSLSLLVRISDVSASAAVSILTPFSSISASTCTSGISIS